jgi:hypothetical protein
MRLTQTPYNDIPQNADDYVDMTPGSASQAALSVAFMFGLAAVFLFILKRSGFRAMVAVGRGS